MVIPAAWKQSWNHPAFRDDRTDEFCCKETLEDFLKQKKCRLNGTEFCQGPCTILMKVLFS